MPIRIAKFFLFFALVFSGVEIVLACCGTHAQRPTAGTAGNEYNVTDGWSDKNKLSATNWLTFRDGVQLVEPTDGDFSWDNQGTATTTEHNGAILLEAPATVGDSLRVRHEAEPAQPFTVKACFVTEKFEDVAGAEFGMGCRSNAGGGDLATIGLKVSAGGDHQIVVDHRATSSGAPTNQVSIEVGEISPVGAEICLQFEDNDTNRIFSYSMTRRLMVTAHTELNTDTFTCDQIGWYVNAGQATEDLKIWLDSWQKT